MAKVALLVGINYYNTANRLNGCVGDIINMRNMLIDAYGYLPGNIILLHDDVNNKIKANGLPTCDNIIGYLAYFAAKSSKISQFWFHYSGHGAQIKDKNGDELDKLDDVIVPLDYQRRGFIVDDDILTIVKQIKCDTMLLFDSCHSGTVCDLPWSFECLAKNLYKSTKVNNIVLSNPNIHMFSGCKDNQTSVDTYDVVSKKWVGAFTEAFIESLRATGHNVAMPVLHRSICGWLSSRGYTQVPLYSASSNNPNYILNKTLSSGKKEVLLSNVSSAKDKGNPFASLRFSLNPSAIPMVFNTYLKE
jgi:hypothetical protein